MDRAPPAGGRGEYSPSSADSRASVGDERREYRDGCDTDQRGATRACRCGIEEPVHEER